MDNYTQKLINYFFYHRVSDDFKIWVFVPCKYTNHAIQYFP